MGPDPMDEGLPHDMDGVTAAVDLQQENVNLKTRLAQVKMEMEQRRPNDSAVRFKENLLSSVGEAMICIDLQGIITYWNAAAASIYGWTSEEAVGSPVTTLVPGAGPEMVQLGADVMAQLALRKKWRGECSVYVKGGGVVDVMVSYTPIIEGQLAGVMGVSSDISDKNRREAEILWLNAELEQRVVERSCQLSHSNDHLNAELAEHRQAKEHLQRVLREVDASQVKLAEQALALQQLVQDLKVAQIEAESASILKTHFLVVGMTHVMMGSELTGEQRECMRTIQSSGDSLLAVINSILDLSKLEAGELVLENTAFPFAEHLEDSVDTFAVTVRDKGVELVCNVDHSVPSIIISDPTRLRQVFTNLLANALKFTEEGEVVIEAHATPWTGPPPPYPPPCMTTSNQPVGCLHVSIRDTGIGISPSRMDNLFLPFSQLDASKTRRFGGAGLGLVISKQLVNAMGGDLWAESAGPGCGSTFRFTVALYVPPPPRILAVLAPTLAAGGAGEVGVGPFSPKVQQKPTSDTWRVWLPLGMPAGKVPAKLVRSVSSVVPASWGQALERGPCGKQRLGRAGTLSAILNESFSEALEEVMRGKRKYAGEEGGQLASPPATPPVVEVRADSSAAQRPVSTSGSALAWGGGQVTGGGVGRGGEELAGRAVLVVMRNASCRNAMGAQIVAGGASVCLVETRREGVAELAKCQVAGAERVLGRGVGFDVVVLEYVEGLWSDFPGMQQGEGGEGASCSPILLVCPYGVGSQVATEGTAIRGVLTKPVHQSHLLRAISQLLAERQGTGGSPRRGGLKPSKTSGVTGGTSTGLPAEGVSPSKGAKSAKQQRQESSSALSGERPPGTKVKLADTHPLRILLVEDNVVNQRVASSMLKQHGYATDISNHGGEAIEALQRKAYDLVFMDVQMPIMDGIEATHRIHAKWTAAERPRIVAMTANVLASDRMKCLNAGMDAFVPKPVRPKDLMSILTSTVPLAK